MKWFIWLSLASVVLAGCRFSGTPTPAPTATVMMTFDLGGGGAGFAATLYAQEVNTGKTVHVFYPAGSHGGVVLPTSPPVAIQVDAPGTYVFYARLSNDPDSYHYGATGCSAGQDCPSAILHALDVSPGGVYQVTIADRKAVLPVQDAPVTVPWQR
jgi:hypothetical protein